MAPRAMPDTTNAPIGCTLNATELADRREVWRRLGHEDLRLQEEVPGGVRCVYAGGDEVAATLRELVALEAECCAFAEWELRHEDDHVILTVTAPDEGAEAVRAMFRAA